MSDRRNLDRAAVGAGAGLLVVATAALVFIDADAGTLRAAQVTRTIGWLAVAFVGYVFIVGATQRVAWHHPWRWLLVLGLGLRLALVATTPTLSDDVYRYLWEGHLVTEGVSPYAFTIDDPAGDRYDIPIRASVNNPTLASPYLPAAHAIFGAVVAVFPSHPATMQFLMIGFDVLGGAMIVRLLALARLPTRRVLLYWLNPLVIVEVAHGAHIDAIIVGLAMAGVLCTLGHRRSVGSKGTAAYIAGPVLVALATLTRPLAVFLAPVLWWKWDWRQRFLWAVTGGVPVAWAVAANGTGLSESGEAGAGVFGSMRAYTDTFRFNSGLYHWLETWVASQGLDDKGWNEPLALTRLVFTVSTIAVLAWVFVVARRRDDPRAALRLMAVPVTAYVLFTPVVHPWYLLLLLALTPFLAPGENESGERWLVAAPWLVLSATVMLSYLTYRDPAAFAELVWVRRVVWLPTFALLAVAGWWLRRSRRAPSTLERA